MQSIAIISIISIQDRMNFVVIFHCILLALKCLSANAGETELETCNKPSKSGALFSSQRVVTTDVYAGYCVALGDLNGDGFLDLVYASEGTSPSVNSKIAWYKNTNGKGTFGKETIIVTTNISGAFSVAVGDFDADGSLDLVSGAYQHNEIAWYKNTDGKGTFSKRIVIPTNHGGDGMGLWVVVGDFNHDGFLDVASASSFDNKIAWYKNTDGRGTFGTQIVVTTNASDTKDVAVGDIDGDGYLDLISASISDNKIAWYRNTDGKGTFSKEIIIATDFHRPLVGDVADFDGDGHLDFSACSTELSGQEGKVVWYRNTDGKGTFSKEIIVTTDVNYCNFVTVGDLDKDGHPDLFSSTTSAKMIGKIAWYKNDGPCCPPGQGSTDGVVCSSCSPGHYGNSISGPCKSCPALSYSTESGSSTCQSCPQGFNTLADNAPCRKIKPCISSVPSGAMFSSQKVVATNAFHVAGVTIADLNGDGRLDLISTSGDKNLGDKVVWYPNTDGKGAFGKQITVHPNAGRASNVVTGHFDSDQFLDLAIADNDGKIAWYKNIDGKGKFKEIIVTTRSSTGNVVVAGDFNNDGFLDLAVASGSDNTIAWYKNKDGKGTFGKEIIVTRHVIKTGFFNDGFKVGDLDNDGSLDVSATKQFTLIEERLILFLVLFKILIAILTNLLNFLLHVSI